MVRQELWFRQRNAALAKMIAHWRESGGLIASSPLFLPLTSTGQPRQEAGGPGAWVMHSRNVDLLGPEKGREKWRTNLGEKRIILSFVACQLLTLCKTQPQFPVMWA